MATAATASQGSYLSVDLTVGQAGPYTKVPEIMKISGPGFSVGEIDVTNLDSPNNTKEYIPGLVDPGDLTAEMNWLPDDTTHIALFNDVGSRTVRKWKITLSGTTKVITFSGYVKTFPIDLQSGAQKKINLTVRISGAVTIA